MFSGPPFITDMSTVDGKGDAALALTEQSPVIWSPADLYDECHGQRVREAWGILERGLDLPGK